MGTLTSRFRRPPAARWIYTLAERACLRERTALPGSQCGSPGTLILRLDEGTNDIELETTLTEENRRAEISLNAVGHNFELFAF